MQHQGTCTPAKLRRLQLPPVLPPEHCNLHQCCATRPQQQHRVYGDLAIFMIDNVQVFSSSMKTHPTKNKTIIKHKCIYLLGCAFCGSKTCQIAMHRLSAMAISTSTHRLRARNSKRFNLPSLWAVPSTAVRSSSQSLLERVSRYFPKQCDAA